MKNKKILTIALFCFLIFIFFLIALYHIETILSLSQKRVEKICFEKKCFKIETAEDEEERKTGLMFRDNLEKDKGMLFIFENEGIHGIWMKNTLIPLDIIWLDKNMEVVYIKENALPCEKDPCPSYKNNIPAKYVLEINAGKAEKIKLKIGDRAKITNSLFVN